MKLSPRMEQIVELIGGRGLSYIEVSAELEISEHTVRTYVEQIAVRIGGELRPRDAMVHHWTLMRSREAV